MNFFYPIVNLSGARDKDTKGFTGNPVPAFFKTNVFLDSEILKYKETWGNDFTQIIFTLSKTGKNYIFKEKTEYRGVGKDRKSEFCWVENFKGQLPNMDKLPDFMTIWQPKQSEALTAQYLS